MCVTVAVLYRTLTLRIGGRTMFKAVVIEYENAEYEIEQI